MGVNYYRLKEKYLKKLSDTLEDLKEERIRCVQIYNGSVYFKTKYDLNYYLIDKCDRLDSLYKQADIYLKILV